MPESTVKIKIYTGLSLAAESVRLILPHAQVCPPVRRGDVLADIDEGIHVIGIVDGEFFQNFAVTPSEILDAMRVGVRVFGASSMGALRAAELDVHGMVGCGKIYQRIKHSPYFRDDYLGVVFFEDMECGSMPMVDFEAAVTDLLARGKIAKKTHAGLISAFRDRHFSERDLRSLRQSLDTGERSAKPLVTALDLMQRSFFSQKHRDGLDMVTQIRQELQRVETGNARLNAASVPSRLLRDLPVAAPR